MDVNFMAILRYQRYKSFAKGSALLCRNAIVHLENVNILICVLKSISYIYIYIYIYIYNIFRLFFTMLQRELRGT